jgi:hypothetical protein
VYRLVLIFAGELTRIPYGYNLDEAAGGGEGDVARSSDAVDDDDDDMIDHVVGRCHTTKPTHARTYVVTLTLTHVHKHAMSQV